MKTSNVSSQGRTRQIGYFIGVSLFVIGMFAVVYVDATNFFGYTLVILSLLLLFVNAWVASIARFKSNNFSIGSALLLMSLILISDMLQEMLYDYPGWGGNGFLLDSFSMMLYLVVVPIFVLFGVILLVKDTKNSLKR